MGDDFDNLSQHVLIGIILSILGLLCLMALMFIAAGHM